LQTHKKELWPTNARKPIFLKPKQVFEFCAAEKQNKHFGATSFPGPRLWRLDLCDRLPYLDIVSPCSVRLEEVSFVRKIFSKKYLI